MTKSEEKLLYRIIAQKKHITITAQTEVEMTEEEARKTVMEEIMDGVHKEVDLEPCVVLPITTKERWDRKCINFCPRCGANLHDYELEQSENFECFECETSMKIHIYSYDD
jgi:predicted Zn-dependent protease